jgi:DNA processing protein
VRLYGGKIKIIDTKDGFEKMNVEIANESDKLIVVEGGKNSGTILVAWAFLDVGKEVWAVPGRINDPNSVATNFLINNGAGLMLGKETLDTW